MIKKLLGKFPSKLPVGMDELDSFTSDILSTYHLPDKPSYRHAVANMIMHLGPTISHAPKSYFAKSIIKAMANQVAFEKIQQISKEEKEKAAELAAQSEVTSLEESDASERAREDLEQKT